jgi:hypothetical protein
MRARAGFPPGRPPLCLREIPVAPAGAAADAESVTTAPLTAIREPTSLWDELEARELGDSTRAYVHLMRVEHRLRAAELAAAIARAERWLAARERRLAAAGRRAAEVQRAVVTGPARSRSRS